MYVVQLCSSGFFQRIWIAVRYVFGYECRYGHWDCWSLNIEDAESLKKLLEEKIEFHDEHLPSKEFCETTESIFGKIGEDLFLANSSKKNLPLPNLEYLSRSGPFSSIINSIDKKKS